MNLKTRKKIHKNEEGFTLVEVIAVLVILGILAAVAVPKFFDMQNTARTKAIEGAVGELNGQVALAFAQNALNGGDSGGYQEYTGYLGPDFKVMHGAAETTSTTTRDPEDGTIEIVGQTGSQKTLDWVEGPADGSSPGYFQLP